MGYKDFIKRTIIDWYRKREWEWVWEKIYDYIRKEQDKITDKGREKQWTYNMICDKKREIYDKIEREYESYFCFYNAFWARAGYDWVNWNDKLKRLLSINN